MSPDPESLQRAQALVEQAWETPEPAGRRELARQALILDPGCPDALVFIAAEFSDSPGAALTGFERARAAAAERLGEAARATLAGGLWADARGRAWMRAVYSLAQAQRDAGDVESATESLSELLKADEDDPMGVRCDLALLHSVRGAREALGALLARFESDESAPWRYTAALVEFRASGQGNPASDTLLRARLVNPHVPDYLFGRKPIPRPLPPVANPGTEAEAAYYVADFSRWWAETPGAAEWLARSLAAAPSR